MTADTQSQPRTTSQMPAGIDRDMLRAIGMPILLAATFLLIFAVTFTAVFQDPRPRDVPVAIVGPQEMAAAMQAQLENAMPGAFELQRFESPEQATAAIEDRDVNAAFIAGPEQSELFIASAAGDATASAITGAFGTVAEAQGQELAVSDIRPLPSYDSRGATPFFVVLGVVIAGMLFQVVSSAQGQAIGMWQRLGMLATFSLLVGLTVAMTTRWITGSIQQEFWSVTGLTALLALAVVSTAAALHRAFGTPGIALAGLTLVVLGISTSGGPLSTDVLPTWAQAIAPWLPPGATADALRNTLYFDANAVAGPIIVLSAWALTALALLLGLELTRPPVATRSESPAG